MRRLLALSLLALLVGSAAAQPDRLNLYSTPRLPSGDVLERLNLKMAWSARIPTLGRRDGFVSINVVPFLVEGKPEPEWHLVVQTRDGLVVELDAETGQVFWKTRVGNPNTTLYQPGYNNNDLIVLRGSEVFALNRKNGDVRWVFRPRSVALSAPLVDRGQFYLNFGTTVEAFALPTRSEGTPAAVGLFRSTLPLQLTPVRVQDDLVFPSPRGSLVVVSPRNMSEFVRFRTEGELAAGPGVHEIDGGLYVGSRDTNLYGFYLRGNEPSWRLAAGGPIERTPFVTDSDIYVPAERVGLLRVNRKTLSASEMIEVLKRRGVTDAQRTEIRDKIKTQGLSPLDPASYLRVAESLNILTLSQRLSIHYRGGERVWTVAEGDRMLAVNTKFVYALDGVGRFLVIDRERGRVLSRYDFRDYPVPVINEFSDRLYLAAHDGLIVCLHDRDNPTPQPGRTLVKPPPPPAPKPEPMGAGQGN